MSEKAKKYRLTTLSCFVGIFVQAIITNLTAILFVPFMSIYNLTYIQLGILVGINFTTQVVSDLICSGLIDKVGFKKLVLPANLCAFTGLILFALTPYFFDDIFMGMIVSTVIFSAAAGLLEVLLSPIVNAIPNDDKGPAMSLMHSFYAWGQLATILITTLFIFMFAGQNWQYIVLIWAVVPLVNFFMFLNSPFPDNVPEEHRQNMRDLIFKPFCMVAFAAIFFGAASELIMNQWASTFMEKAMLLPKVTGDILGMGGFAIMIGTGRMLYGIKGSGININKVLVYSSFFAVICYLITALSPFNGLSLAACAVCGLTVSLLWPGTLITTADRYPLSGAWLFAILAAAGDIGAAFGPWFTGLIVENFTNTLFVSHMAKIYQITSEQAAIRTGILFASIFPGFAMVFHIILKKLRQNTQI